MNILKLPKPTSITSSLRHFYTILMGDICSLKALNIDVSACAPIIVPIIEEKLPGKILSSIGDCRTDVEFKRNDFTENFKNYSLRQEQEYSSNAPSVQDAQPFLSYDMHLSAFEKQNIILTNKLCLNCLRSGHRACAGLWGFLNFFLSLYCPVA